MPVQLPTRSRGQVEGTTTTTSYLSSLHQLFSLFTPPPPPHNTRPRLLRFLLTSSVAVPISKDGRVTLPVRVRPAMIFLTFLCLILLGFLGLTPSPNGGLPIPDKPLHFLSFFLSTLLFYFIFSLPSSTLSHTPSLRRFPLYFTAFVSLGLGGVLSEFVQGALPYKIFDWYDILANLLGGSLGLIVAVWAEGKWRRRKEISRLYMSIRTQGEVGAGSGDSDDMEDLLSEESDEEDQDLERGVRGGSTRSTIPRGFHLHDPWSAAPDRVDLHAGQGGGNDDISLATPSSMSAVEGTTTSDQPRIKGEDLFSIHDEDDE